MKIAMAHLDPIVGDVTGNRNLVLAALADARAAGAGILLCPELAICGYPPRDLLLREGFIEHCEEAVADIARESGECCVIVGAPRRLDSGGLANSAFICHGGMIQSIADKQLLPGYDVFDEDRYFRPGDRSCDFKLDGRHLGVVLCEDMWQARDVDQSSRYTANPVADLAAAGCELILVPSASPFVVGKHARHASELARLASRHGMSVAVVNQCGANDDLVFNGEAFLVDPQGVVHFARGEFEPLGGGISIVDLDAASATPVVPVQLGDAEARYRALMTGIKSYFQKTGHGTAIVGLSGGIDSAMVATLATVALGADNVIGVMMPSRHSSQGSIDDARELAERLGIPELLELPIEALHETARTTLAGGGESAEGVTDQNLQARLRGLLLMAMANERGGLVLSTGNKSELAAGYATLYGDMNGAIAVLGDVYKTDVYDLARWVNANPAAAGFELCPIPHASIEKPPSAELAPDQLDQDTLPEYEDLDDVLRRLVDDEQSPERIVAETDHDADLVRRISRMLDLAQFKRDQAPVILKTSPRTFGRGRPWPIVARGTINTPISSPERAVDGSV